MAGGGGREDIEKYFKFYKKCGHELERALQKLGIMVDNCVVTKLLQVGTMKHKEEIQGPCSFKNMVSGTMRSYEETKIDILLPIFSKEEKYTLIESGGIAIGTSKLL